MTNRMPFNISGLMADIHAMTDAELTHAIIEHEKRCAQRGPGRPPRNINEGRAKLLLMHNAMNERLWQAKHRANA